MITKKQIAKIIEDEVIAPFDNMKLIGIESAAEKILQAIEAAQQGVQATGGRLAQNPKFLKVMVAPKPPAPNARR